MTGTVNESYASKRYSTINTTPPPAYEISQPTVLTYDRWRLKVHDSSNCHLVIKKNTDQYTELKTNIDNITTIKLVCFFGKKMYAVSCMKRVLNSVKMKMISSLRHSHPWKNHNLGFTTSLKTFRQVAEWHVNYCEDD